MKTLLITGLVLLSFNSMAGTPFPILEQDDIIFMSDIRKSLSIEGYGKNRTWKDRKSTTSYCEKTDLKSLIQTYHLNWQLNKIKNSLELGKSKSKYSSTIVLYSYQDGDVISTYSYSPFQSTHSFNGFVISKDKTVCEVYSEEILDNIQKDIAHMKTPPK